MPVGMGPCCCTDHKSIRSLAVSGPSLFKRILELESNFFLDQNCNRTQSIFHSPSPNSRARPAAVRFTVSARPQHAVRAAQNVPRITLPHHEANVADGSAYEKNGMPHTSALPCFASSSSSLSLLSISRQGRAWNAASTIEQIHTTEKESRKHFRKCKNYRRRFKKKTTVFVGGSITVTSIPFTHTDDKHKHETHVCTH